MRFKRNETFRYTFKQPIHAFFKIETIDGKKVTLSKGQATIVNISPGGLSMHTNYNIPDIKERDILLSISFQLNDKEFEVLGIIVWKKENKGYHYGIDLEIDDESRQAIVTEVKLYAKK